MCGYGKKDANEQNIYTKFIGSYDFVILNLEYWFYVSLFLVLIFSYNNLAENLG